MDDKFYGQDFYNSQILGSLQSAQVYLYHLFSIGGVPGHVVDIGCGRGAWLTTCLDFGVKRVVGFDGSWNSQEDMLDPRIEFHSVNLEKALPLTGAFDLAISLEVAEHLQPESSDRFVESLTGLSDAVLFGAAFIGQPGANHINTRLHSFWAQKFFDRGYELFDLFRPTFWDDDRVDPCYRQNTFLYVKPSHHLHNMLIASGYVPDTDARFIDCVHPVIYKGLLDEFIGLQKVAGTGLRETLVPCQGDSSVNSDILTANSDSLEQLIERAATQLSSNQLVEAADTYRRVLVLEPDHPECLLRLSYVLMQMKSHQECFHHACHFLRVVDDLAFGYFLAGSAAREIGRWQESRSYLLKAVELDPNHLFARVLCCMSVFTVCMDQMEKAVMICNYAAELDKLVSSTNLETIEQINNAVDGIGALTPFFLPYLGCDVKELQVKYGFWVCSVMAAKYPQFVRPLAQNASGNRVKIGIVSNYFYNHSNWKIPIKGWLEQLDRQLFSIHCFHTGEIRDTATESARALSETFLQSNNLDLLVSRIHEQNFDVLIYPGIGMDTITLKLAALRLAPVQCTSWGHPVTTGMPTMDYYLSSDLMEPPGGDRHYSEKLIRLPNLSVWYEPAEPMNFDPAISGIAIDDIVFLCCQNLFKYLPQYDSVFPVIAGQVKNSRFVFIASYVPELTEKFLQRISQAFQDQGLNAADYVLMLPQLDEAGFSALNARADIFLDSLGWSGCNTVFESLPFNKPIVTFPGTFMRGRHAYAILTMMGVEDSVAASVEEYISIAVQLANDTQRRAEISSKIQLNKYKIYRDSSCIVSLEKFLMTVSGGSPSMMLDKCFSGSGGCPD